MVGPAYIYEFHNDEGFYTSLYDALLHVKNEIWLTHMESLPPQGYDISKPYYLDIMRQAHENPACDVRRLISIPNDQMALWAEDLLETSFDLDNFEVRSVPASAPILPMINMAVLDRKNIFLANSDREIRNNAGVWIHSLDAGEFYANYHQSLWAHSVTIEQDLERYYKNRSL